MKPLLLSALALVFATCPTWAAKPIKKPSKVPFQFNFVRSVDMEAYVQSTTPIDEGTQAFRLRSRYLDPDVNAFVGLITGLYHFNKRLRINNEFAPPQSNFLWNWGVDIGIKRGRSLWELDLMGAAIGSSLAPVLGFSGDHTWKFCTVYHRSELSFFSNDVIADFDQGLRFTYKSVGLSLGYRIFAATYMRRNGPRAGLTWRFESPKIPFIFPSLG